MQTAIGARRAQLACTDAHMRAQRCSAPAVAVRAAPTPRRASVATAAAPPAAALAVASSASSAADPKSVGAIILGGGAGTRLFPLTKSRAKPAVPIGGAYRLIDVPMSNCINCGINKIYILTQFNSTSLNRHLSKTYNLSGSVMGSGFVEVLAATQTPGDKTWFQGTADAVRQYSWIFADLKNSAMEDIIILSGDHLYRMDYMRFVEYHRRSGADCTIGCLPCTESDASAFGLMKIDDDANITEFAEKPSGEALQAMKVDTATLGCTPQEAEEKPFIASMGIYVFKRKALLSMLDNNPEDMDFGAQVIPRAQQDGKKVKAYLFNGYWEDIGTMKSFFDANLALAQDPPKFEFFDPEGPIITSPRFLPPAKISNCKVEESIISHGADVGNSTITSAIVGVRSKIGRNTEIQDAMIMGADFYESDAEREALLARGEVPIGVGDGTVIRNAIIDKNARIGKNVTICNREGVDESDQQELGYMIRSGIVVVLAGATIPDGAEI
eukprot:jgi/Ulvmu1/6779/UM030_0117.1